MKYNVCVTFCAFPSLFMHESSYCFQRILANAILSVHLSVCPSVTQVDQSKTVQARITKSSPMAAWKTLVSGTVKLFHKFEEIASGYLEQPTTRTDRQDCERLLKLSDWRLVLELGAVGGHFEHSQWQWNFGIWSLVYCVVWLVSMMLLNWCCSLNIFFTLKNQ